MDTLTFMCLSQKFSKEVEKVLGPGGSILYEKRKDKAYLKKVDIMAASMRDFQREPGNLKEYSPWLSSFKVDTIRNEMEVPGRCTFRSSCDIFSINMYSCHHLKRQV